MWAHTLYATPTGGFGRQDEVEQGLAHLFVVGAQEILARFRP